MTPQSAVNSASNILLLALPGMSLTLFHESLQKGGFSTFVENLNFNHIRKGCTPPLFPREGFST